MPRARTHRQPTPRVGGIAIVIAYVLSSYLASTDPRFDMPLVFRLLPSICVVFTVGLIDDFVGLRPWQKLMGQTVGAVLAFSEGVRVMTLGGHPFQSWLSLPLTVAWLLACTNAFNLVDGLDGLASGTALFSTVTIFVGALIQSDSALSMATLPLAGCLLAFLFYNFSPATIFLGDCGSLLVGFLLGCYGAMWSQKSLTLLGMLAPLMAVSMPLLDVVLSVLRRFLGRKPIFGADRGHIHHRLLDRGLSPWKAVLVIYGTCGVAAAFALLQSLINNRHLALLISVAFIFVILAGIRYLGYTEFTLAGRFLRIGTLQRFLASELALENFSAALSAAESPEARFQVVRKHCLALGFKATRLQLNGVVYSDATPETADSECWTIRIPIPDNGFLELARDFHAGDARVAVAQLADLLHATLGPQAAGGGSASPLGIPGSGRV